MRTLVLATLALGLLLALAPPAAALPYDAGASGQCYDAAGNGGEDAARVAGDTNTLALPTVVVPSGTGAVAALAQAAGFLAGGSGCGDAAGARSPDYAEVHVRAGGVAVQACYDDRPSNLPDPAGLGLGAVHTDNSCPTSPGPPGP